MADYTNVQHADIDDAAVITSLVGHSNLADYVSDGLTVNIDNSTTPPELAVSEGTVFCLIDTQEAPGHAQEAWDTSTEMHECLLKSHLEERTGLSAPVTDGVNHVWVRLHVEPGSDPEIVVTSTDEEPSDDSVKIAEADLSTDTVTAFNTDPDGSFESLFADDLSISGSMTWPDGVTTDGHPLSAGEALNNINNYYDTNSSDPQGVVEEAVNAQQADAATTAAEADYADEAGNAQTVGGKSAQDIIDAASVETAGQWTPILDEPYVDDEAWNDLDVKFRFDPTYDRYKITMQVESFRPWTDAVRVNINGIYGDCYRVLSLDSGYRAYHTYGDDKWDDDHDDDKWDDDDDDWKKHNVSAFGGYDDHDKGDGIITDTRDHFRVCDVGPRSHVVQEFHLACPETISDVKRHYPMMHAGEHFVGPTPTYQLSGFITESEDAIDKIHFHEEDPMTCKIQIYAKDLF